MTKLLERAEYDRQIDLFLADRGRMPTQYFYCMHCDGQWVGIPTGAIIDDPMAGWHQDHLNQEISGVCQQCAEAVVAATPRYGSHSHEDYLIECERDED